MQTPPPQRPPPQPTTAAVAAGTRCTRSHPERRTRSSKSICPCTACPWDPAGSSRPPSPSGNSSHPRSRPARRITYQHAPTDAHGRPHFLEPSQDRCPGGCGARGGEAAGGLGCSPSMSRTPNLGLPRRSRPVIRSTCMREGRSQSGRSAELYESIRWDARERRGRRGAGEAREARGMSQGRGEARGRRKRGEREKGTALTCGETSCNRR